MSLRDNTERHLFYKDIYKHRGYAYPKLQNPGKNHHFLAILFMKSSEIELDFPCFDDFPFPWQTRK